MMEKSSNSERNWVMMWAAAIMLLTSLPYIWGIFLAPNGYHFLGFIHNIDDSAVYLSWMRQAADGHFFIRNLFTSDPQSARAFNVLFLVMGNFARIMHLPLVFVFHLFRVGLGVFLIWSIWRFSKLFLDDPNERGLLIPLIGLSAGIGWMIPNVLDPTGSVDMWQPEAITFLALYLNPLFLAGLALMVWSFYFLIKMSRTGRAGDAAVAGIMLLLLGNIHTYDVITVACVWIVYIAASCIAEHKLKAEIITRSLLAALIALPSIVYQYYIYRTDPVYAARANSPAPSPEIWSFFAGYGLILIGAIVGSVLWIVEHRRRNPERSPLSTLHFPLLIVWSVVGFALPYIPISQQRKLVMGLHIPLCILCAYALCKLIARVPSSYRRSVFLILMLVMAMSNVKFVAQDMRLLSVGRTATHYAPFMSNSDLSAMRWLREHTRVDDTVFAAPTFALFTPAFTGHQVYYGHWSETPDYASKINDWFDFVNPGATDEVRSYILRETGAKYVAGYMLETRYLKRVGPDVYEVDNAL
ncbi:MAG: hypothetical protein ABFD83_04000 [Armatimonadota bacterium]